MRNCYAWQHWYKRHHERLKRFIEAMPQKLVCQECGGMGRIAIDHVDGYAIYGDCGWCEGIGYVTPHVRGFWLRWKRGEAA